MMLPSLQDRFNQLLGFAKSPSMRTTAHESLAAARELVETLLTTGHLEPIEYSAYQKQITAIRLMLNSEELALSAKLIAEVLK